MNTLRLVSVLLVLILAVSVESSNLGQAPSAAPSTTCTANGAACTSSNQCCGGSNCFNNAALNGGVCQPAQCFPASCAGQNTSCCLGTYCISNVCQAPSVTPSVTPAPSVTPSATLSKSLSPVALTPGQLTPVNTVTLSVPSPLAIGVAGGRLIVGINGNTDVVSFATTSSLTSSSQPVSTLEATYTSGEFFGTYAVSGTPYVWVANAGTGSTTCNRYRGNADNSFTLDNSFNCGTSNGLTVDQTNNILYVGSSATSQASVTTYNLNTLAQLPNTYIIPETNQTEITNIITCPGGIYVLATFATPNNFFHFSTGSSSPDLAINLDTASRPLPIGAAADPTCTYLYVSGFADVDVYRIAGLTSTSRPIQSYGVGSGSFEGITYDSSTSPSRVFVASSQDNTVYGIAVSS